MRFDLDEITALVAARCEELLDRVADRSEVDLIADLALPLPIEVLGARLGIPPEDVPQISDWADVFNLALGRSVTPSVVSRAEAAALEFEGYVSGLLRDGRLNPGILYDLHQGVEQSRFGLNEMLATSLMLVSAGRSTVTDLIGSAALGLARDQQTENQARKDGNGVSEMLDEVLRLFSPVQMTRRVALTPLSIGGQSIKAGERVIPVLAAANRDPMIFPAPLETDDRRDAAKRHLAFGAGRHRCPGANLAQVEAAVAIRSILERFAPLELREEPTWKHNPTFRGLSRLVVSNPRRGSRTVD
jgi:cytochrome P450